MKKKTNPRKINCIESFMISKLMPNIVFLFGFRVICGYEASSIAMFHPSLGDRNSWDYNLHSLLTLTGSLQVTSK